MEIKRGISNLKRRWFNFQSGFNQNLKIFGVLMDGSKIIYFIQFFKRKAMLEDKKFGSLLHKLSIIFFSKNFAYDYIKKSRINESYK